LGSLADVDAGLAPARRSVLEGRGGSGRDFKRPHVGDAARGELAVYPLLPLARLALRLERSGVVVLGSFAIRSPRNPIGAAIKEESTLRRIRSAEASALMRSASYSAYDPRPARLPTTAINNPTTATVADTGEIENTLEDGMTCAT
jgi:hypothetical protein